MLFANFFVVTPNGPSAHRAGCDDAAAVETRQRARRNSPGLRGEVLLRHLSDSPVLALICVGIR